MPGQALTCHTFTVEGQLAEGEEVKVKFSASQTNPGKSENFLSWKDVKVMRGTKDTTSNYDIVIQTGTLEVTPP